MADPFDTLGVEARYDLDRETLEQRHRTLSGTLHPDRYAGKSASERRMALDKAIAVNAAFRALRDPIRRAEALLARHGVETGDSAEPKASPELLMEIMEVREGLAEARAHKDLIALGTLSDRMREKEKAISDELAAGFDGGHENGESLRELLPLLGELRYVRRFFEELEAAEDELLE